MTIYDIAEEAGVSASMVSRVINNKKGVSEKKRKLVQEILDKHNYIRDENARNLVMQKTNMIGIVTDDLSSTHQNAGLAHIQNVILRAGYYCFVRYCGKDVNAYETVIKEMAMKRVEGVLLMGVGFHNHGLFADAVKKYLSTIPVVLVHQTIWPEMPNVYAVGADESKGIARCVDYLVARERKHIVLMIDKNRVSRERIKNDFMNAIQKHENLSCRVYDEVEVSRCAGENAAGRILQEYPQIDGLICVNDMIAIGASYGFQKYGKRIPEDVSIIGEDNSELCEACSPRLTSLDPMLNVTTVMSASLMIEVLEGMNENHSIAVEMNIVERETA